MAKGRPYRVVTGDIALDAALRMLQKQGIQRVMSAGIRPANAMVGWSIRAAAPRGATGNLKRSIGWRAVASRRSGFVEAKSGVNVAKKGVRVAPHAHLVGLGVPMRIGSRGRTKIRGRFHIDNPTRWQARTGEQNPNAFVRVGYRRVRGRVLGVMRVAAARQLLIEVLRARRGP